MFLCYGLRRELDHYDRATKTGWEVTKIDFNNSFDSIEDFEELRRKLVQLEKDAEILRRYKLRPNDPNAINQIVWVVPESLPTKGRGAELTLLFQKFQKEGLNLQLQVVPLP